MRFEGTRLELGMKLNTYEPCMIGYFNDLRQESVGRNTGEAQACRFELVAVARVDLITMAVALRNAR